MAGGYQGPHEGFRGEVTKASLKELRKFNSPKAALFYCPSCEKEWKREEETLMDHAIGCTHLRADVANGM